MKNSSFWISLLVFILLMCSCRSKKVATVASSGLQQLQVQSEVSYLNESVKIDTSRTSCFATEAQRIVIEEVITAIEYDEESGKPIKETKTERKVTQDTDKVAEKEEAKRVSIERNDSLNHIAGIGKKVETESETVKESHGSESFRVIIGLVTGCAIGLFVVYLLRKLNNSFCCR